RPAIRPGPPGCRAVLPAGPAHRAVARSRAPGRPAGRRAGGKTGCPRRDASGTMVGVQSAFTVTPAELPDLLLHVAVVPPGFAWGARGIGKSSLVRAFAASLALDCVTLVGTQLAAEDLIGVPELRDGRSRFAPPESIARDEPYCLFLDELNSSTPEVQKAFYS